MGRAAAAHGRHMPESRMHLCTSRTLPKPRGSHLAPCGVVPVYLCLVAVADDELVAAARVQHPLLQILLRNKVSGTRQRAAQAHVGGVQQQPVFVRTYSMNLRSERLAGTLKIS